MTDQVLKGAIESYIGACNAGDADRIAECFSADATHYFPGLPKWTGAATIGQNFSRMVRELGYCWTVDETLTDGSRRSGLLEWTQFQTKARILRGVDLFLFEANSSRIREIRCYTATPVQAEPGRYELTDFDYPGRGYPIARP